MKLVALHQGCQSFKVLRMTERLKRKQLNAVADRKWEELVSRRSFTGNHQPSRL